jgi:hypothetical protein
VNGTSATDAVVTMSAATDVRSAGSVLFIVFLLSCEPVVRREP